MRKIFALIIVLCVCFLFCGCGETTVKEKSTYESAVIDFSDVYNKGKTEKLEKLAPNAVIEYLKENEDFDIEKRRTAVFKEYELLQNGLEKIYGENVRYSITVNSKESLEKDMLERMREQFFMLYRIPKEDVKEVVIAHFTAEFSGNDKKETEKLRVMVVNIEDKWYVCDSFGTFGILKYNLYY
ncbi:MAG: hypothetical protein E7562_07565 [Ruminococcaceae bacterium]|nr:hypothetical protein [Oscillospiraceae bacterium]